MKRLLGVVLAAALWASPVLAEDTTNVELQKPITLDQALAIAFRQNPGIRVAVDQIERSRFGMDEAQANFMPRFNLDVNQQYQGPPVTITLPGSDQTASIVKPASTAGALSMFFPLDINRRLAYTSDIAKQQFLVDYLNLSSVSQTLILDVKVAYYTVMRARGQEDVAQASVDVAAARLKDTNARYTAGTAPKFDVTRAQVDVANLNQTLIQAKSRVAVALAALNRVMGIDVNSPTELVKSEVPIENLKVDIDKSVDEAYALRPEIKVAQTAIVINETNAKIQRTAVQPSFGTTATYNYSLEPGGFSSSKASYLILLNLRVPIWDGGVAKAKVAEAYADVKKARDTVEQVKLGIALETRTAALFLQQAIERVATTAEGVALAQESLRLANVRYNAGISVLVEVIDAESALTQANFNYVDAQYDYATAYAQLQRATSTQPELAKLQLLKPEPGSRG